MNNSEAMVGTRREGFGERSLTETGETHGGAMAAAAQAAVQARFVMAIQRPRSWDNVRVKLLQECKRPGFAAVARYNKPVGKGVRGPSIRFAEACFRYAGNLDAPITTTFEDKFKRILHVQLIDFETNASYSADITIDKTVERKDRKDRVVLAERKNSRGDNIFIVEATEDELLNKQNALVSKALRTLILRMIPGDIVEEGQAQCVEIMANEDAKDPTAARKKLIDSFADIGVMPSELEAFLGHALSVIQPAEMAELREAYAAVRDGEATWRGLVEAKHPSAESAATGSATTVGELDAQLAAAAKAPAGAAPQGTPAQASGQAAPQRERRARATAPAQPPATQEPPKGGSAQQTDLLGSAPPGGSLQQQPATPATAPAAPVAPTMEEDRKKRIDEQNELIGRLDLKPGDAVTVTTAGGKIKTHVKNYARIFGDDAVTEVTDIDGKVTLAMITKGHE